MRMPTVAVADFYGILADAQGKRGTFLKFLGSETVTLLIEPQPANANATNAAETMMRVFIISSKN